MKPFLSSFVGGTVGPVENSEYKDSWEELTTTLRKAEEQLAAAAYCSTVYETLPDQKLSISAKENAVGLAKKKVFMMGITVPVPLTRQLELGLKTQQALATAAAKAKPKKTRGGRSRSETVWCSQHTMLLVTHNNNQ